jgi:hypothetical protein
VYLFLRDMYIEKTGEDALFRMRGNTSVRWLVDPVDRCDDSMAAGNEDVSNVFPTLYAAAHKSAMVNRAVGACEKKFSLVVRSRAILTYP